MVVLEFDHLRHDLQEWDANQALCSAEVFVYEPHFSKLFSTLVFIALYFQWQLKDSEELLEGNCLYAQTLGSLTASEFPVPAAVSEIGNISFML